MKESPLTSLKRQVERNQALVRPISLGLIFVAYLAATWTTMVAHEPWRDEAYAWLMARDASFGEFFKLRAYDGTPALWYLMLMPLARLGLPYLSMSILHLALAAGIVALILWRSPFSLVTKVLLVFSFYLFWQYPIYIRLYTVGLFLLFLAAALYGERASRPIPYALCVALMFNCNLHMVPMAGALLVAYSIERVLEKPRAKRPRIGLAIMAAGALLLVAQLRPFTTLPDVTPNNPQLSLKTLSASQVLQAPTEAFFVGVEPVEILGYAAIAVLILSFYALASKPIPLLILAMQVFGLLAIFSFLQRGFTRHHGLLLLGIVFCLWIAHFHRDRTPAALPGFDSRLAPLMHVLNFCLLISTPMGFMMHGRERAYDFSGGKNMAEFIKANGLDRQVIAAHHSSQAMSVLPYLPGVKFWYAGIAQYGTYVLHNRAHYFTDGGPGTYERALSNINRAFPGNEPVLVLLDNPLDTARSPGYRLLHKVDTTVFGSDERFYLYLRERG
jgi:hypothetical protein